MLSHYNRPMSKKTTNANCQLTLSRDIGGMPVTAKNHIKRMYLNSVFGVHSKCFFKY